MTRMPRCEHCQAAALTQVLGMVYCAIRGFLLRRAGLMGSRGAGAPPSVRAGCRSAERMFLNMQAAVEALQHRGER